MDGIIKKNQHYISFLLSISLFTLRICYKQYLLEEDVPRIVASNDSSVLHLVNQLDIVRLPFRSPFLSSMWSYGTMQTLIPTIIRNLLSPFLIRYRYEREKVVLDDGGTVGIDWVERNNNNNDDSSPLVIVQHGLAGNSYSEYVTYFVKELLDVGIDHVAVMVSRGCGGIPLTTKEVFSAAKSSDTRHVVNYIKQKYPNKKIYLVGFSLGAGLVLKYVSDFGVTDNNISGAVAVCPFWNWNIRGPEFSFWNYAVLSTAMKIYYFSNIRYFLKQLHFSVTISIIFALNCDYFNGLITQYYEIYGYNNLQEYYNDASPLFRSHLIPASIPTLTINADSDPVCSHQGCPAAKACGSGLLTLRVKQGGHLAFQMSSHDDFGFYWHGLSTRSFSDKVAVQFIQKLHTIPSDASPRSVDELTRSLSSSTLPNFDTECYREPTVSIIPKDVISAYNAALYYFQSHDSSYCLFKPNEDSKLLASIMTSHRSTFAAFITAYNPSSLISSDESNKEQQNRLKSLLKDMKLQYIHGYSSDKYDNWKEQSFLIFDCDKNMAYTIAKKFNQNAFIWMQFDYYLQPSVVPKLCLTR